MAKKDKSTRKAEVKVAKLKSSGEGSSEDASEKKSAPQTPPRGSFRAIQPPLSQDVLEYLDSQNFHTMTPVQEATIPLFLTNKDVAVQAVTGSGKTLAFLIPIVERIRKKKLANNQIGALILSPTRELAIQTGRICTDLCKAVNMTPPLLLVGGGTSGSSAINHRPVTQDLKTFQKDASDIVIATPGRMEDVLTRYSVMDVSELEVLVLDEADVLLFGKTMIDPTIAAILNRLPRMRRTGIFSATTTFTSNSSIKTLLSRAGMRNPVLVNVQVGAKQQASDQKEAEKSGVVPKTKGSDKTLTDSTYTPTSLTNYYMITPLEEKLSRVVSFIKSHRNEKMIIFLMTCACVEFYGNALQKILGEEDIYIETLHGKLVQKRREKAMERFRESKQGGALFCTDIAARGLDVADVEWVVQIDSPQDPSQFVHRVGRSARAGRKGSSLVFLSQKEEAYVDLLANRQVPLTQLPSTEACYNPMSTGEEDGKDSETVLDILPEIKKLVLKDRDYLEKGTKAFTSFIRAYKEHVCAFIFRFASLDLGHLATSFCLVRLPKMPELRESQGKLKNFTPAGPEVNIFGIPFLDKPREVARQKRLAAELAAGGKNAKQIQAEQRKAEKLKKQADRRQAAIDKGRNPEKKRGRNAQLMDEWEELAKEERLYKKLRRKKITKEKYDELMHGPAKVEAKAEAAGSDASSNEDSDSS